MTAVHSATIDAPQAELAEGTYLLTLRCPAAARSIRPGQFVMFRDEANSDPLLGRPFALYDVSGETFTIAYHVIGKQTQLMTDWQVGQTVRLWGPLGNGFPSEHSGQTLLFVGGGIGYSPFPAVARDALGLSGYAGGAPKRRFQRATLIQGARTAALMTREDYAETELAAGLHVERCTDDGSSDRPGRVTDLLDEHLAASDQPDVVFTCGPVGMMKAVAERCQTAGVVCYLSLETPMACGYGACFSCVVPVKDESAPEGWDYRRSCVEGPVFDAAAMDLTAL